MDRYERWETVEVCVRGTAEGNPFAERMVEGIFRSAQETKTVSGFYDGTDTDGAGRYIVRFMPSFEGIYQYEIRGNFAGNVFTGSFEVVPAAGNNRGPVGVREKYHFSYADGTPFYEIGTTCYAWAHQPEELQEQTLRTLAESPFNKIRFCVFPKHYDYNLYEPVSYPYEGTPCGIGGMDRDNFEQWRPDSPENHWDFRRFNPVHFRILEQRIRDLQELGIEADLILFHPYDRWGFSCMGRENDLFYLRYVMARFAAYRNVWWSLANEYDLCADKTADDWEAIAAEIVADDPYAHLRSIHNCRTLYDFSRPWVTHCSVQRTELFTSSAAAQKLREKFGRPVIFDEVGYEGNLNYFWGNLSGQEMVRLFWAAAIRGGYCGHGETFIPEGSGTGGTAGLKLWWSHGGELHGESAPRLAFLSKILAQVPGHGLRAADPEKFGLGRWQGNAATAEDPAYRDRFFLFYTDRFRPAFARFDFGPDRTYHAEIIDTWNMTVRDAGTFRGLFYLDLPSKPFMAVRITEADKPVPDLRTQNADTRDMDLDTMLQKAVQDSGIKWIVLDDDPTGIQAVHDVAVYTDWSAESIREGLHAPEPLFFILTNSRSFSAEKTAAVHAEIARNILAAASDGTRFAVISRGDSTLRGHYPLETETLKDTLEAETRKNAPEAGGQIRFDGEILMPFFLAGGRITKDDIHYVRMGGKLVPAAETEFAKDVTFGYHNSDLKKYIEEKTGGACRAADVTSIGLTEIRAHDFDAIGRKLMGVRNYGRVIVNAETQEDVKVFVIALYRALAAGKNFLYRTAADFVKQAGGISDRPLLTGADLRGPGAQGRSTEAGAPQGEESGASAVPARRGGIVMVGSHTEKTTKQLEALQGMDGLDFLAFDSDLVLQGEAALTAERDRVRALCEKDIAAGITPVVSTRRTLLTVEGDTKERALARSVAISDAFQSIVGTLGVTPAYVVAKGGITSNDIGVKALQVRRAFVPGQIEPGIPVWKTDGGSRFPGIPYVIFPGNVGEVDSLRKVVEKL